MLKRVMEFCNFISPLIIIGLTLLALARTVTRREVETIVRNLQAKDADHDRQINATLEAIRKQMDDEESWQQVKKSLQKNSVP